MRQSESIVRVVMPQRRRGIVFVAAVAVAGSAERGVARLCCQSVGAEC